MTKSFLLITSCLALCACGADDANAENTNSGTSSEASAHTETLSETHISEASQKTPPAKGAVENYDAYQPLESAMTPDNPDAGNGSELRRLDGPGRVWNTSSLENTYFLDLSEPETDNREIGFSCNAGSGEFSVLYLTFHDEWEQTNTLEGFMPLTVYVGLEPAYVVETHLQGTEDYPGDAYALFNLPVDSTIREIFNNPDGIHLRERENTLLAPYASEADIMMMQSFLNTCEG
ncbi:hypothetical protein [Woodsholea maritima]|uniref:hypothetical protein n=1 Tax=Woodsholea maritima TaxID=240237 RepID=UPI00035F623F|nr:hypothetical protein [Woodsholea maritima]